MHFNFFSRQKFFNFFLTFPIYFLTFVLTFWKFEKKFEVFGKIHFHRIFYGRSSADDREHPSDDAARTLRLFSFKNDRKSP